MLTPFTDYPLPALHLSTMVSLTNPPVSPFYALQNLSPATVARHSPQPPQTLFPPSTHQTTQRQGSSKHSPIDTNRHKRLSSRQTQGRWQKNHLSKKMDSFVNQYRRSIYKPGAPSRRPRVETAR